MFPQHGYRYKVKYKPDYGKGAFQICLIAGSNVRKPSGTHSICLKNGDIIEFDSISFDGTVWFNHKGERLKYIGNGWNKMLENNLVLV